MCNEPFSSRLDEARSSLFSSRSKGGPPHPRSVSPRVRSIVRSSELLSEARRRRAARKVRCSSDGPSGAAGQAVLLLACFSRSYCSAPAWRLLLLRMPCEASTRSKPLKPSLQRTSPPVCARTAAPQLASASSSGATSGSSASASGSSLTGGPCGPRRSRMRFSTSSRRRGPGTPRAGSLSLTRTKQCVHRALCNL